jgi:hypothetical protein
MRSKACFVFVVLFGLTSTTFAQDDEAASGNAAEEPAADADKPAPDAAESAPAEKETKLEPSAAPTWWFGAYVQGAWVPSFMLNLFLGAAPTVGNAGFGVTATHRDQDGFSLVMGLGYQSYSFTGPFRIKGDPEQDTEYVRSNLGLLHLRGQVMWSTPIVQDKVTFDYGVGVDLGVVLGQMHRSEAYRTQPGTGAFHPCQGPLTPGYISPSGLPYCELPQNLAAGTDKYNQHGAQYNVVEKRVPPVALVPMLPALSLRYTPIRQLAIKLDAAFGLLQFAVGVSAAYGIDL